MTIKTPGAYKARVATLTAIVAEDAERLVESIRGEFFDIQFYANAARAFPALDDVVAIFTRLSAIEQEHAEVFERVIPPDIMDGERYHGMLLDAPAAIAKIKNMVTLTEVVKTSIVNERNAIDRYTKFAAVTKNPRLQAIWANLAEAETQHFKLLSEISGKYTYKL